MPTYTDGFGIKLIATGAEAGTWGSSTNSNLEMVDEALASYYEINVNVPPTGSTWTAGTNTLDFLLPQGTTARANGSQGRATYISFEQTTGSGGTAPPSGEVTINIRGNSASDYPDRCFIALNGLTSHDITFDLGGGASSDFKLFNGQSAIIQTDPAQNYVFNASPSQIPSALIGSNATTLARVSIADSSTRTDITSSSCQLLVSDGNTQVVGYGASAGSYGTALGNEANGTANGVSLGYQSAALPAGQSQGTYNTAVGMQALSTTTDPCAEAQNCVAVGTSSSNNFTNAVGPSNTVAVGVRAGTATIGSGNIFIGYEAKGTAAAVDNRLVIENSSSSTPLIAGDFATDALTFNSSTNSTTLTVSNSNTSLSNPLATITTVDASNGSNWAFLKCIEDSGSGGGDVMFRLDGDGNGRAATAWETGGFDYAEFFEWSDGNSGSEDRVGYPVVLESGMVRIATGSDDPSDIIGIVSGVPGVIGNSSWGHWHGKYEKDSFGRVITEDVEVISWDADVLNGQVPEVDGFVRDVYESKYFSYRVDQVPVDAVVPADASREVRSFPVKSSDFDEAAEYVPREDRSEWAVIGMLGQIHMRSGSPTHPNWRKIREESDSVEVWLVR